MASKCIKCELLSVNTSSLKLSLDPEKDELFVELESSLETR